MLEFKSHLTGSLAFTTCSSFGTTQSLGTKPILSSRAQHSPFSGRTSPAPRPFPSLHHYLPARTVAVRPGPTTATTTITPRGLEFSPRACARRRHVSVLWARDAARRPPPRGLRLRRARARARVRGAAWPGPAAAARPRPAPRRRRRRLAGHEAQPAPERGSASRLLKRRLAAPPPPPSPAPPSPPRPAADPPFAPLPPRGRRRRHVGPRAAAGPPLSPRSCPAREEAAEEERGARPAAAAMAEQTYSW